jgi:hypothetical protein
MLIRHFPERSEEIHKPISHNRCCNVLESKGGISGYKSMAMLQHEVEAVN